MTITYQHRIYIVETEAEILSFLAWVKRDQAAA